LGLRPQGGELWGYNKTMSVKEIEAAVSQLPPMDLADFSEWFEEFQADAWDRQIAQDVRAGRFDSILQRVEEQAASGQCKPL
jgi:hypothetical protein